VRIRYYALELMPKDVMLLCSDGLHGVVANELIEETLSNPAASLEEKCRTLISAADDAGSPDNVTVVLLQIANSSH